MAPLIHLRNLLMLVCVLALASCATAEKIPAPPKDIVDTAAAAGNFNTLVAAVRAAGLAETLKGPGPYTVFAPTDEAFKKLPPGTVDALMRPENKAKLQSILKYHVVPGKVMSSAVTTQPTKLKTLEGSDLDVVRFVNPDYKVNTIYADYSAEVIKADVGATNGVIHVVDKVMLPD